MNTCTKAGCESRHLARGLCKVHYQAALHAGVIVAERKTFRGSAAERLAHYSRLDGECLIWTGSATPEGYGKTRHGARTVATHRLAYELENGPIPAGIVLDHRCHNTMCMNLEHLRPATSKTNAENLRGATSRNKTGYRGVSWVAGRSKFRAAVKHHGETFFLGHFDTAEQAGEAARLKRIELFTFNDLDRIHDA